MADTRKSKGYTSDPPTIVTSAALPDGHPSSNKKGWHVGVLAIVLFMIVAGALSVVAVILAGGKLLEGLKDDDGTSRPTNSPTPPTISPTFNPTVNPTTSAPTPPTSSPTLNPTLSPVTPTPTIAGVQFLGTPETVFQDQPGDLISLVFPQELSVVPEIVEAFSSAARRWSDILEGTDYGIFGFNAGEELCPGIAVGFIQAQAITTLHIVARVAEIDTVGQVLGSAGPCLISLASLRTVTGQMLFDLFDVFDLINDGSFESVVLHEMGHVLGIGTLWRTFELLQNPVFSDAGINLNLQPGFLGDLATGEFRNLTGNAIEEFVPVENGVFRGVEQFDRANGQGGGSIDGHWDKDFFQGELMEFQIASGAQPPMSRTTIASLADLGYNVGISLAQEYTPPSNNQGRLRGGNKEKVHELIGDVDLSYVQFI